MGTYRVEEIEGVGPVYAAKLEKAGIKWVEDLLEKCASRKGRGQVAEETGIEEKLILKWTNHADLMRIKGVGPEYSELLEAAGVDTVKELATRRADNLAAKMAEVNAGEKYTRNEPSAETVGKWVAEAKTLPAVMTY